MERPKPMGACPFCGNPLTERHNDLCMSWKYRKFNTIGNMIAWIALMIIIIGAITLWPH